MIEKYAGADRTLQKIIAIEELTELAKELCKDLRNNVRSDKLDSEMADVSISLDVLKRIYGNELSINKHIASKIKKANIETLKVRIDGNDFIIKDSNISDDDTDSLHTDLLFNSDIPNLEDGLYHIYVTYDKKTGSYILLHYNNVEP